MCACLSPERNDFYYMIYRLYTHTHYLYIHSTLFTTDLSEERSRSLRSPDTPRDQATHHAAVETEDEGSEACPEGTAHPHQGEASARGRPSVLCSAQGKASRGGEDEVQDQVEEGETEFQWLRRRPHCHRCSETTHSSVNAVRDQFNWTEGGED